MALKKYALLLLLLIGSNNISGAISEHAGTILRKLRSCVPAEHPHYYHAVLHHHWNKHWPHTVSSPSGSVPNLAKAHFSPAYSFDYGSKGMNLDRIKLYQKLYEGFELSSASSKVTRIDAETVKRYEKHLQNTERKVQIYRAQKGFRGILGDVDETEIMDYESRCLKEDSAEFSVPVFRVGSPKTGYKLFDEASDGFIEGHMVPFEYETIYPYVLVTAFARNTINYDASKMGKYLKWFTPIEQALGCLTFGEYRKHVAILKDWDAYSDLAIVVIPPKAKISYFFGPVAPKTFPSFFHYGSHNTIPYKNAARGERFTATYSPVDKISESLAGGATQLFIQDVSEFHIYEASEGVTLNKNPRKTDYVSRPIGSPEWPGSKQSHLMDPDYNKAAVDLHGQLLKWGIINSEEHAYIDNLLNGSIK
jgi:hypothetical protein